MVTLRFGFGMRALLMGASLLVLDACTGDTKVNLPAFFDRVGGGNNGSSELANVTPTMARPTPDARGVITYPNYQVLVSNDGDTFNTMAARVGLTGEELARHNGLPVGYRTRSGEIFALPRNVGGELAGGAGAWNPAIVATAIDRSTGTSGIVQGNINPGGVEPQRHRAEAGETAYSIARLYNVSVTALASWNGLGPDLAVRPGQTLLIPAASPTSSVAPVAPAIDVTEPGSGTEITPPPSADEPLPEVETASVLPESPNLVETRTPDPTRLSAPVSGSIVLPYSPAAGPNKNEGVDFGSTAGAPVKAAADGKVALISEARGGLGTIVLIQHAGGLITIYGRIAGVTVTKGQQITRGQTIGVVADNDPATLHFEVRKGTQSVDPAPYF